MWFSSKPSKVARRLRKAKFKKVPVYSGSGCKTSMLTRVGRFISFQTRACPFGGRDRCLCKKACE